MSKSASTPADTPSTRNPPAVPTAISKNLVAPAVLLTLTPAKSEEAMRMRMIVIAATFLTGDFISFSFYILNLLPAPHTKSNGEKEKQKKLKFFLLRFRCTSSSFLKKGRKVESSTATETQSGAGNATNVLYFDVK